jgi:hypothetical protein
MPTVCDAVQTAALSKVSCHANQPHPDGNTTGNSSGLNVSQLKHSISEEV